MALLVLIYPVTGIETYTNRVAPTQGLLKNAPSTELPRRNCCYPVFDVVIGWVPFHVWKEKVVEGGTKCF